MTPWRCAAAAALLALVAVTPGLAGSEGCPSVQTATREFLKIGGATGYSCTALHVTGELSVLEGGTLTLSKGSLTVGGPFVVAGHLVADDVTIESAKTIKVDGQATLTDVDVHASTATASPVLHVTGGLVLRKAHVVGQTDAILLDGADAELEGTSITGQGGPLTGTAVTLRGGATLTATDGDWQGELADLWLASGSGGSPAAFLTDTPAQPQKVDAGRIEQSWRVSVRVEAAAPISLADVVVTIRAADGSVEAQSGLQGGRAGPFALLGTINDGTLAQQPDRSLEARAGSSAVTVPLAVDQARTGADEIVLQLPFDDDRDDPVWPEGAQLAAEVAQDALTTAVVTWPAADDTLGGAKANRGVARYELHHSHAGQTAVVPAAGSAGADGLVATLTGLSDGQHTFRVRPIDLVGRAGEFLGPASVDVDGTGPPIQITANGLTGPGPHHSSLPFTVTVTTTEPAASLRYALGTDTMRDYPGPIPIEGEGETVLRVEAQDAAGVQSLLSKRYVIDRQAPRLTVHVDPAAPDGRGGWYLAPPGVSVNAEDVGASGIHSLQATVDEEALQPVTGLLRPPEGRHVLLWRAVDLAGNGAVGQRLFHVDATPPALDVGLPPARLGWYAGPIDVTLQASDAHSGVTAVEMRWGSGPWTPQTDQMRVDSPGISTFYARAVDAAGHETVSGPHVVRIDGTPPVLPEPSWRLEGTTVHVDWQADPPTDAEGEVRQLVLETVEGAVPVAAAAPDAGTLQYGPITTATRLQLRATDAAGWSTVSQPMTFRPDPAAVKESLHDVVPVRGVHVVRHHADAAEVRLYVDGTLSMVDADAPFAFDWDSRRVADGTHVLRTVAQTHDGTLEVREQQVLVQNGYLARLDGQYLLAAAPLALALACVAVGTAGALSWRRRS